MFDPFHQGEREVQERTGERERALMVGRLIGAAIPAGATAFLAQQHYCVAGAVSPEGEIWSSFLVGPDGFAASDETGAILSLAFDPHLVDGIRPFSDLREASFLGLLFIDLSTRRRLRVNGTVSEMSKSGLRLNVREAFPNCPKYIQRREASRRTYAIADSTKLEHGEGFNDALATWITAADTFFVASAYPDGPVDVSHRGGNPGFVQLHDTELLVPDYPGNSMFGTLGNFAVNPRAGLVFVDFQNNRQLQLTGAVRLELDAGERAGQTEGTGRRWAFSPRRWTISPLNPPLDWVLIDASPFNP